MVDLYLGALKVTSFRISWIDVLSLKILTLYPTYYLKLRFIERLCQSKSL